ncbi:MAG TPA: UDP-N-acetylglucosamine 1-carboxyvinyltransferase [Myxococcales bacterium]|nr:UDP-N-acetylglucosamine 1-carboxyvinyltransferase [Myxococcales bacterium]
MDALVIRGGRALRGEVEVSGAKNAALPAMAASLLAPGEHRLRRVPRLADVATLGRLLGHMGVEVERGRGRAGHELVLRTPEAPKAEAPYEIVKTMRGSVLVLGPLLARVGRARVSLPGGCAIGARPIDQHLKGLAALGADIQLRHGYVEAAAPAGGLRGARVAFDVVTVTGTENLLMAAALAKGTTVLENAAREPEVSDLGRALTGMGAHIQGAGSDTIEIEGVPELRPLDHEVIADRIEAGTLLVAAAATGGDVELGGARAEHLEALLLKLREAGVSVETHGDRVRVRGAGRLRAVDVRTAPFPGFATDMQAQTMALLTVADGSSVIEETVFENRFMHVLELHRMGADIAVSGRTAVVKGVPRLSGAPVMATDLRASASLVIAGLVAEGTTTVQRVYHLDRGYERLERKLRSLGGDVRRVAGG